MWSPEPGLLGNVLIIFDWETLPPVQFKKRRPVHQDSSCFWVFFLSNFQNSEKKSRSGFLTEPSDKSHRRTLKKRRTSRAELGACRTPWIPLPRLLCGSDRNLSWNLEQRSPGTFKGSFSPITQSKRNNPNPFFFKCPEPVQPVWV